MRLGTYYRYFVVNLLKLPLTGKKILDIGGYDGFLLSTIDGERKTLIDISPHNQYSNIQYIQGDFLTFDFKNEWFDLICAFDVIEHIQRDEDFLEKIINLLSPSGVALLSTPSERIRIFPPVLQGWVDKKWGHIYRRGYSKQKLVEMATKTYYQNQLDCEIIEWNAPLFRFLYLPLRILWYVSESFTKKILNRVIFYDATIQSGNTGFLFIILKKNDVC
jgi:2-polyprenyl-3-methyl-5-hydroxy-6-metoxy-1,4-benzoquinol methylase